jgi:hypothetical protein
VAGEPPSPEIIDLISVGLGPDLKTFAREFFRPESFIVHESTMSSAFKIVEAYYGGGKTHYLRAVEREAHKHNFASAFVGLTKDECPLTRFDQVYGKVMETITVPGSDGAVPVRGIAAVIRQWVASVEADEDQRPAEIHRHVDAVGDLPLVGIKIALREAALAIVSGDTVMFDEALEYLTSGKIPASLRKRGVLQAIDAKNGSLALRTVATLIRKLGWSGFVLILDEGDRSLSLGSARDKQAASNNLVQLINETGSRGAWPSTLLLYSIPSWQSFQESFGDNQALIQRTAKTGFPSIPPAPRIVLDDRQQDDAAKTAFCVAVAERLVRLYLVAYPGDVEPASLDGAAEMIADRVLHLQTESTFRRAFVQSFLQALFAISSEGELTDARAETIVNNEVIELAKKGS